MSKQNQGLKELKGLAAQSRTSSSRSLLQLGGSSASSSDRVSGGSDNALRSNGLTASLIPKGIQFGSPSQGGSSSANSASTWGKLVSNAANGGISNAFSGGLSSIAGLGGLVSGLFGLFGGGKTQPPPLVRFQLPVSQQANLSVGGTGSKAPVYGSSLQASTSTAASRPAPAAGSSQQQIVDAVKNALLNSSSLNDVISEL